MEIKRQFVKYKTVGEINTKPSETVPDDALTVRQIIEKFVQGINTPSSFEKTFSDDLPDIRFLDITELNEMAEENANIIAEHKKAQEEAQRSKKEAQAKEIEELKAYKKHHERESNTDTDGRNQKD